MSKQSCRSDFISDGSSSDGEDIPQIRSLWQRVAQKKLGDSGIVFTQSMGTLGGLSVDNGYAESRIMEIQGPETCQATVSVEGNKKKKRSREEIEENRKLAQTKKEERERKKQEKEAEKDMRRLEREAKKTYSLNSCLQFIKVLVDTRIVNSCGLGTAIFKVCEELGVACETQELTVPFTVVWKRKVTSANFGDDMKVETVLTEIEENEVITIIPVADFVQMVETFKQRQRGLDPGGCVNLRDYVTHVQSVLVGKNITVVVPGMEQYFRDLKTQTNREFKKAVQPDTGKRVKKLGPLTSVSRLDVEEALTDLLLQTDSTTFMLESPEDVADLVRRFSKAVAERPAKKDRYDPIFSFHEEGAGGVKVDKNGNGLLKVWKHQLLQFKNVSPDVAQAIIAEYPSPYLLRQAYSQCASEKEAISLLENIVVRRGAGVLETTRRVGKELARRFYILFTCEDPDFVIK
ncbi:crossover junction endonuclease EME1-like [Dreissena polymorpha]|uniref:ERCC4 domain-containing protein n=1 Tax=Dreissena polymorpha TaxID=45954 RepID=A0A9D4RED2_DREPO|nr:crossover junction endonuclease EME1-like [Dreissena polymorpha]KAH3864403.1 hypothetical protein DPMN_027420 [Dreissena polymorpha]